MVTIMVAFSGVNRLRSDAVDVKIYNRTVQSRATDPGPADRNGANVGYLMASAVSYERASHLAPLPFS
jgi:hypothetical protein